ncbi:MAG: replication initiator protein A [Planctomycetota bacterium]
MNLIENCFFSATNRVDRTTKSLKFESEANCKIEKRRVNRKLTVAFSAEYGRPTPSDDMVLVALMKLTRDAGFSNQKIYFSRYELIKVLKWSDGGRSYERIDEAMNRLIGTHLVWDNAFWDNSAKSWVDRKFNLIDDVYLYDREKYERALAASDSRPKSWFKWSDVMFESFNSGYIKTIDLQMLQSLREVVGRRLYRWLDKHFNNPNRKMPVEISIEELATKKLGFKKVPASHLKRMMQPAITELEEVGFVACDNQRFSGKGNSSVVRFTPQKKNRRIENQQTSDVSGRGEAPLLSRLTQLGISGKLASQWLKSKPETVAKQLKHLDYLNQSGRPPTNKAAWLTTAIKSDFTLPEGVLRTERGSENSQNKRTAATKKAKAAKGKQVIERKNHQESRAQVAKYLQSLTGDERTKLEKQAIERGSPAMVDRLKDLEREGEAQIAAVYREQLVAQLIADLTAKKQL